MPIQGPRNKGDASPVVICAVRRPVRVKSSVYRHHTMPVFSVDQLTHVGTAIFEAAGVPREQARIVAESLAESNLVGHDSHGVLRIPQYLEAIDMGMIKPGVEPRIVKETPATATVDGQWGFGQFNARWATELAVRMARHNSVSTVALINNNHVGRLGEYALIPARQGMICMILSTGGSRKGQVAPYGGRARRLNTAPISVGVPAGRYEPFLMDFATSVVAEGKVMVKLDAGESMPEGWVIDVDGNPTTDPEDYVRGGALLPFGGHKGYSLALFIEIMAGILTGAGYATSERSKEGNSIFVMALDISSFRPLDEFEREMEELIDHIRSTPPLPGIDRVIIPGEPELNTRKQRLREGIHISDGTWERLAEAARKLGLDVAGIPQ